MLQAMDFDETPVKKMAQTMQNFSSRKGMRGPIVADRSISREGVRKKDPMRESTMSFFKEAFSQNAGHSHTDSMAAFYLS